MSSAVALALLFVAAASQVAVVANAQEFGFGFAPAPAIAPGPVVSVNLGPIAPGSTALGSPTASAPSSETFQDAMAANNITVFPSLLAAANVSIPEPSIGVTLFVPTDAAMTSWLEGQGVTNTSSILPDMQALLLQALLPLPATPVSLIVQQDISSLLGYYEVLIARKNDQLYLVNFTSGTNGQGLVAQASYGSAATTSAPITVGESTMYLTSTVLQPDGTLASTPIITPSSVNYDALTAAGAGPTSSAAAPETFGGTTQLRPITSTGPQPPPGVSFPRVIGVTPVTPTASAAAPSIDLPPPSPPTATVPVASAPSPATAPSTSSPTSTPTATSTVSTSATPTSAPSGARVQSTTWSFVLVAAVTALIIAV